MLHIGSYLVRYFRHLVATASFDLIGNHDGVVFRTAKHTIV